VSLLYARGRGRHVIDRIMRRYILRIR
jgi:hypothetical protein